ncbi:BglG family transcription antiterminator LicT [Vagococcus acidifermentans]|uniref:Transcription antiterminator BglG n=1 Tax=Vagococcus acidifermentans TaxID=564710 RepID=A0A430AQK2_9ENTE|nr:PRD domain-containing protein [Vagococcus acidifermentans]RSU10410.1 transcription antiterminator BglG [Vagococcus acidifermentans]
MIIKKILNNNVVISVNDNQEEVVVMGRGIAFNKRNGDQIDQTYVEKVFTLAHDDLGQLDILELVKSFDPDIVGLSKKIISMAEEAMEVEFSEQIYLTFTDHLHYTLKRAKDGIFPANPLLFDIKKFYPVEFKAATQALALINDTLGVELPEDEAGFFALHFVNSTTDSQNLNITMEITELVRDILNIISRFFGTTFDESSLSYSRMITHIQYFVRRILTNTPYDDDDEFLYELVKSKYPQAYNCSLRISDYLKQAKNINVKHSELIYLVIHINRVIGEDEAE